MKTSAQLWLTSRASPAGMLACGIRRPDGKCVCHSIEDICPAGRVEKILGQFESLRTAYAGQVAPRWTTWCFEHGQIRLVLRPDGWLLGLVIRAESDAYPKLDPLSLEFLSLDFSS